MTEELDLGKVSASSFVKKGYSFILANVGKTVAAITLLVAALVTFTEISFSGIGSAGFTSTLVMMLISSYVMYFSLEDAGEKLGRECESYIAISKRHEKLQKEVRSHGISELREFCTEYRNLELDYRRQSLLFSLGYTKKEYEAYINGEEMSRKAKKDLMRVKKIRPAELNTAMLLSNEMKSKSELKSPERDRILNMVLKLIPTTVCMLFTVSVMVSTKDNMTSSGVIEAILKLSALPVVGLKGYSGGYEYATVSEYAWLETKCSLLESFLKSKGNIDQYVNENQK